MPQQIKKRIHLIVSGRVQGVFFRAETRDMAQSLHLVGCVRNMPDGRVEIIAQGDENSLNKLIEWTKHGPSLAQVIDLQIDWLEPSDKFNSFHITH